MRLIDADAIEYESLDSCDTGRYECYYGTGIVAVRKEDIDEMPTIEPERKGTWINEGRFANYHGGNVYRCSRCGNRIIENEPDDFCKHCGSDNRGGKE